METACGNSNNNGLVKNTRKGHDAIYICVFFTGVPRKYSPKNRVNIYLVKMYKCGNDVTLTKHFVDPSSCPNRNRDYSNFLCSKPFDNTNACASYIKATAKAENASKVECQNFMDAFRSSYYVQCWGKILCCMGKIFGGEVILYLRLLL